MSKTGDIKKLMERATSGREFTLHNVRAALVQYYDHDWVSPETVRIVLMEMVSEGRLYVSFKDGGCHPNRYVKLKEAGIKV